MNFWVYLYVNNGVLNTKYVMNIFGMNFYDLVSKIQIWKMEFYHNN